MMYLAMAHSSRIVCYGDETYACIMFVALIAKSEGSVGFLGSANYESLPPHVPGAEAKRQFNIGTNTSHVLRETYLHENRSCVGQPCYVGGSQTARSYGIRAEQGTINTLDFRKNPLTLDASAINSALQ